MVQIAVFYSQLFDFGAVDYTFMRITLGQVRPDQGDEVSITV